MYTRIFVPAAVAALLLSAAVGVAPAAAQQQNAALATDSIFILNAASTGLLQAKLGKLAAEKGSSPSVKEFGKRMVDDYAKANEELAAAAKQAAYPRPVLLRDDKKVADRFSGMDRAAFDKAYMTEMLRQHDQQVALFRQESEKGKVVVLKQLAAKMLPELEQRQSLATETARSVGADVTASSSDRAGRGAGAGSN
jgi:putative membrane protein